MTRRWPRYSLATLFIATAIAAILFAYLRTLRDGSVSGTGHRSISGALSKSDVEGAAKSLETFLLRNGYSPSSNPPHITANGKLEWYSRSFGVGEIYVSISH